MRVSDSQPARYGLDPVAGSIAVFGGVVTLFGTYWDDSWHTDRGRDSFWVLPHISLYTGVLVVCSVTAWWLWKAARDGGWRAIRTNSALVITGIGGTAVLVSAPIDDGWHTAFGRDAVLWSPPHMLALTATIALVTGVLAGIVVASRPLRALVAGAAALLLGAALVPVMEYDADVPQFSVRWYLPVATLGIALTASLLERLIDRRWQLTTAALGLTGARAVIVGGLAALGFSLPIVPPVIVPAILDDFCRRRHLPPVVRSLVLAVTVHGAYVPYVMFVPNGVPIGGSEVGASLVLAWASAWLVFGLTRHSRRLRFAAGVGAFVMVMALSTAPAFSHDPGQGPPEGEARIRTTVDGARVRLTVSTVDMDCSRLRPSRATARRAGMMRTAPLDREAPCSFRAEISGLEEGRWFLYAEWRVSNGRLETWLPVELGGSRQTYASRVVYEVTKPPSSKVKNLAGAVLYAIAVGMLALTVHLAGRATDADATLDPA